MKEELPLAAMEKLLRAAGAKRVSEQAKQELQKILSDEINKITKKAALFSEHAGRKTIKKEDISISLDTKS